MPNPSCLGRVCGGARKAKPDSWRRTEEKQPGRRDRTAFNLYWILNKENRKRSPREIVCCVQVRRGLLRAEPELPRSRLRGGSRGETRRLEEDGGKAAGQMRPQHF
ncbi:hypothetical protein NDU88_004953 [Pleurodeles waltl]|uniref:Uncharacterized protein n=1 Tax=Pleurodeles waltl TaxID=8319 RepID=A0AAV7RIB3_PLEWA|nr:hypothetical protein NDU88_004953 [Pleurodeles waltl]